MKQYFNEITFELTLYLIITTIITSNMEYIQAVRETLDKWGEIHPAVDFLLYHIVTIIVLSLILLTICIHRLGSSRNLYLLTETHLQISPFIKQHFSYCTDDLMIQSPNIIKSYASGNPHTLFLILAYAMVPRQQMVSFFCNWWLIGLKDEAVFQVPIKNDRPVPLTLAIVRKKNVRMITKKDYPDIKYLCKEYKPLTATAPSLPSTHSMLLQNLDHVRYLLATEKEIMTFQNHGNSLKLLYLSDVNKFSRYPMAVRMVVELGKDVLPLLEWLMAFAERMSRVRMAVGQRRQARKKREQFNISYQK